MPAEEAGREPRLVALHRLWRQKSQGRAWPARRDFSHGDLRPWFGNLFLLDVLAEPLDFRCRLFGTALAEALGVDFTNKLLSRVADRIGLADPREGAIADFRRCALAGEPQWRHGYWPLRDHSYVEGDRLLLPLSSDGAAVDKILGAAFFVAGPA